MSTSQLQAVVLLKETEIYKKGYCHNYKKLKEWLFLFIMIHGIEWSLHYRRFGNWNILFVGQHHCNMEVENFHCIEVWHVLETMLWQGTLQNQGKQVSFSFVQIKTRFVLFLLIVIFLSYLFLPKVSCFLQSGNQVQYLQIYENSIGWLFVIIIY